MIPYELPQKPKIIEEKGNLGIFEIEELSPGHGTTIGNALRRVLFSSLEGAAITSVKIKGTSHEFSTLPYVMEDIMEIILNLKQVRFKYFTQDFPQKAELKIKGKKEAKVRAKDIEVPPSLEIANPEQHIATITDKRGEIEMEIWVEKGVGYEPVEQREKGQSETGIIPLDAIFTPIRKANFRVENMRVGDRTDFNRLFVEIETDGTITPENAFLRASETLVSHFQILQELPSQKKEQKTSIAKEKKLPSAKASEGKEDLTKLKIEDKKFSKRTVSALITGGIKTLGGLLRKTEKDLFKLDGFGAKSIKEIKRFLKKKGLSLKE